MMPGEGRCTAGASAHGRSAGWERDDGGLAFLVSSVLWADGLTAGFMSWMKWAERRIGKMIGHVMLESQHKIVVFFIVRDFIETLVDKCADLLL
jgi:hypothetical protein